MTRQTMIWTLILLAAGAYLAVRAFSGSGMGKVYVKAVDKSMVQIRKPQKDDAGAITGMVTAWAPAAAVREIEGAEPVAGVGPINWTIHEGTDPKRFIAAELASPGQREISLSLQRTLATWWAAFLTLCIFSFLYRDNPLYKFAESVFIGVSAAYWMVVGFWTTVVPNLVGRVVPTIAKDWALPGLSGGDLEPNYWYIAALVLGVMLLWRLAPNGAWIARWPLAFFIGTFAGLRLVQFLHADFLSQIRNSIVPLVVLDQGSFGWDELWLSLKNFILVIGVLACLTYFFFSFEHKGAVGRVARLGTWVLMITFGAMFGYTVMGRITLLSARLEFLLDDWLWLIDPLSRRALGG